MRFQRNNILISLYIFSPSKTPPRVRIIIIFYSCPSSLAFRFQRELSYQTILRETCWLTLPLHFKFLRLSPFFFGERGRGRGVTSFSHVTRAHLQFFLSGFTNSLRHVVNIFGKSRKFLFYIYSVVTSKCRLRWFYGYIIALFVCASL